MGTNKISRRSLLQAGMAVGVGSVLPKTLMAHTHVQNRPIVGDGEHTYEVFHDWMEAPPGMKWGDTHGLTADSQGRIYVAHTVHATSIMTDGVAVYDPDGKFINSWGPEFKGGAHGLDIRKEGSEEFLYHCDTRRRVVVKTTLTGEVVWERGRPSDHDVYADGKKAYVPTNVAFDPNGDVFVADGYGSHWIHRWSADGDYKGEVISPGREAGHVSNPHGLWLDERGDTPVLAVADRGNNRVQNFTLDGKHIDFATEGMRKPCHMKMSGDLMLVPDLSSVVTVLGKDNKPLALLGDGNPTSLRGASRDQFIPGKFVHPHDAIWVNHGRDILVAEWVTIGRVTLLKRK
jgi:hypothetical protein